MARRSNYEILKIRTKNISLLWQDVHGIATERVALKFDSAMLKWQSELTDTLEIWIDKATNMTEGELILARANLGAVVESWLRFFYCVFYDEYINDPMKKSSGKILEPEKDMRFEDLKKFSTGILWDDEESEEYIWVEGVQKKRNAIHSFTYRNIGTAKEFLEDIEHLYRFVDNVLNHLPPIEDIITEYPAGYVLNVFFD